MFALEVELLTGRYVATEYNDRGRAEWPPHPARLYSALVAAHFESSDPPREEEASLRWLESQTPPEIQASEAWHREVVTVFVPVNDASALRSENTELSKADDKLSEAQALLVQSEAIGDKKAKKKAEGALKKANQAMENALIRARKAPSEGELTPSAAKEAAKLLPESRGRQPRTFPSVHPEQPVVSFVWPDASPSEVEASALAGLAARVVRLGHSSSLVRVRLVEQPEETNFVPDPDGDRILRVPRDGQLTRLKEQFLLHREVAPRVLPAAYQPYRLGTKLASKVIAEPVFGRDWIVLARVGGPRLPSSRAADVAAAVRNALMRYSEQPVPEILSGHRGDGSPSEEPHLAVVPLPFVGRQHADGAILGVALVFPRCATSNDRAAVFAAVSTWESAQSDPENPMLPVQLGAAGLLELHAEDEVPRLSTLRPSTWCRPSRRWVSVSPVALDRNPGDLRSRDPQEAARAAAAAEATVTLACERCGLPAPSRVAVIPHAGLAATEKAKRFAPFPREKARTRRVLAHAIVEFHEPVRGPLLLGAGRFLGIGLFRPVSDDHDPVDE